MTISPGRMPYSAQTFAAWGVAAIFIGVLVSLSGMLAFPEHVFAEGAGPGLQGATSGATVDNSAEVDAKGGFNLFDMGTWLPAATAMIASIFLTIAALLAGLAVTALNAAVELLVFNFGTFFGNSAGLLAGWSILRDIGNILLLFGFVSIGVQTILNINHFNVGKTLPRLILFAILLNFSLFVTEAIIDATNGVASVVYMQADSTGNAGSAIGGQSGIISIVNAAQSIGEIAGKTDTTKTYIYLLLALFLFIATFALLAGAILLVTRAVVLVFLMLTSPIGFAGMAIPRLNKIADQWWSALIGNALFAPAYLILLLVSLKMLSTLPQVAGSSGSQPNLIAAAIGNGAEMGSAVVLFFLTVGFLLLSVIAAKQFGVMGASFATKLAGAAAYGVPGLIGRKTIGAASNRAARAIRSTGWGANTVAGRNLARLADVGAKASFDARSATPLKAALKAGKIDAGEPSKVAKGGRREELKDIQKRASEDAEQWEKARKTTDGIKKDGIERLQREENIQRELGERANDKAVKAREQGSEERAKFFEGQRDQYFTTANQIKESREKADKGLKTSQFERLTKEQQILQKFAARGGSGDKEREESKALKERQAEFAARVKEAEAHAANIKKYFGEAEAAAKAVSRLEKEREEALADRRAGVAGAEERLRALEIERQRADAAKSEADTAYATAKEAGDKAEKARKEAEAKKAKAEKSLEEVKAARKKIAEGADEYLKPSYALQQIAQSLDRLSRMPFGSDFAEAARGIRANAGQSKEARLAHDLQHMLEHASHGDHGGGHKEDHGAEKHEDHKGGAKGGGDHGHDAPHH